MTVHRSALHITDTGVLRASTMEYVNDQQQRAVSSAYMGSDGVLRHRSYNPVSGKVRVHSFYIDAYGVVRLRAPAGGPLWVSACDYLWPAYLDIRVFCQFGTYGDDVPGYELTRMLYCPYPYQCFNPPLRATARFVQCIENAPYNSVVWACECDDPEYPDWDQAAPSVALRWNASECTLVGPLFSVGCNATHPSEWGRPAIQVPITGQPGEGEPLIDWSEPFSFYHQDSDPAHVPMASCQPTNGPAYVSPARLSGYQFTSIAANCNNLHPQC